MIFQCKNCGGNVVYSPEKKTMICPFCDSEKSENRQDSAGVMNICPNCAGEIPIEDYTSATQCPYCDSYLIMDERIRGEYEPKKIIPFQLGKETCKKSIREKFKRNLFAPIDFLSEVRLNGMQGYYVPFWLFDYETHCSFKGEGTKVRTWRSGNTEYTETSYYDVTRELDMPFKMVPVDASVAMPDEVMDLMEPYNYGQMEDFTPEYMSGFRAERYNMSSEELEERAQQKMKEDAAAMLKESYAGYHSVKTNSQDISILDSSANYGLLPVWKYVYTYKGQEYLFYVNGQTGKIVGEAPTSKEKVFAYTGTLWGCLIIILMLLPLILKWM